MLGLLNWLATKKGMLVQPGGRHQYLVKCAFWERPFPIPFKHNEINRFIVDGLMKKLIASGICTQEEFDEKIKKASVLSRGF